MCDCGLQRNWYVARFFPSDSEVWINRFPLLILFFELGEGEKRMQIPDGHAGEVWTDVLGWSQGEVTIGDDVSFLRFLEGFAQAVHRV